MDIVDSGALLSHSSTLSIKGHRATRRTKRPPPLTRIRFTNSLPYLVSFDFPSGYYSPEPWSNVLVFPGPARPRYCRAPLDFDKWIPSVLFLTHYLPDDPESSQVINIASLILGHNGIWGDLLTISKEGVARFGKLLAYYKQVRDDITEAHPVRSGVVGGVIAREALTTALTVSPFLSLSSSALRRVIALSMRLSPTRTTTWAMISPS